MDSHVAQLVEMGFDARAAAGALHDMGSMPAALNFLTENPGWLPDALHPTASTPSDAVVAYEASVPRVVARTYFEDDSRNDVFTDDGWFRTGDVATIDREAYIQITDRKKDIIVNSGGDNVAPQRVEGMLTVEPEIEQAMVYGDKRPHLVALLVPNTDFAADWASFRTCRRCCLAMDSSGPVAPTRETS